MKKTVVINVVGLSSRLLGEHTPQLKQWIAQGRIATIKPVLPAVTCTAQATYLTGRYPTDHGIVANGWYFHDDCEIKFWRQSNKLVQSPKIWDVARSIDPEFTCANLFWWYNMYSSADYSVTPRPMYPADGRKLPDIYTQPADLRSTLQTELGEFPLFKFWGPATSAESSQWIAASAKRVEELYSPTLTLIYLPHLDYCLQKIGCQPDEIAQDLQEIDAICGDLIAYYENRGAQVILLSEYGITPVNQPIHLNRVLRQAELLQVREELGRELLDAGASKAFAVADHQIAHVYVNDPSCLDKVKQLLEQTDGVDLVLDEAGKEAYHLDHPRSGDLIAVAKPNAWFTYYYWMDDRKAPDFARTVDIHRKPGYDPAELFIDPRIKLPKLKLGTTLLKKKLGFRYLMEVIPLDASVVKGSHGHLTPSAADCPMLITRETDLLQRDSLEATDVFHVILSHLKR
ncbi:nucleotide pyrophosphatase/phosphodiesterase family protein [Leptolyngbya sp. FACHB-17]|uniref:alkaline phosphatase family protein n=1 Tax=unclassified Leptolyngbya TaxID=2650499 RepID=UPI001680C6C1|nr:nucleotide pyrophosphatase/phosphodiesterase family protein [Leptolyngbya sp. FACHB-17]MBD2080146.1 alkaline phosphatase family protein [Leptolyngbya sp. FACHB-17]